MDTVTILAIALVGCLALVLVALAEVILAIPSKVISSVSGWGRLAEAFPGGANGPGRVFRFCTVRVNVMPYRSCITATVGDGSVTLTPMFPFRAFHAPISLPIDRLERLSRSVNAYTLTDYAVRGTGHTIGLPARVASLLR